MEAHTTHRKVTLYHGTFKTLQTPPQGYSTINSWIGSSCGGAFLSLYLCWHGFIGEEVAWSPAVPVSNPNQLKAQPTGSDKVVSFISHCLFYMGRIEIDFLGNVML